MKTDWNPVMCGCLRFSGLSVAHQSCTLSRIIALAFSYASKEENNVRNLANKVCCAVGEWRNKSLHILLKLIPKELWELVLSKLSRKWKSTSQRGLVNTHTVCNRLNTKFDHWKKMRGFHGNSSGESWRKLVMICLLGCGYWANRILEGTSRRIFLSKRENLIRKL